jgi:hypothetical protein
MGRLSELDTLLVGNSTSSGCVVRASRFEAFSEAAPHRLQAKREQPEVRPWQGAKSASFHPLCDTGLSGRSPLLPWS